MTLLAYVREALMVRGWCTAETSCGYGNVKVKLDGYGMGRSRHVRKALDVALFTTSLYFHTPFEKLTGYCECSQIYFP